MIKLKKMYNECCMLQEKLLENTIKAKFCLNHLNDNPNDCNVIEQEVEKLEKEIIECFNLIEKLEL